jgi:uncharacterized protein YqeY
MRARDAVRVSALRLALTAVKTRSVAGPQAEQLTDDEVRDVLRREVKKCEEAAALYEQAQRPERAQVERSQARVLAGYLPAQLDDATLADVVAEVADAMPDAPLGKVIAAVRAQVGDGADGARVAAMVKARVQS